MVIAHGQQPLYQSSNAGRGKDQRDPFGKPRKVHPASAEHTVDRIARQDGDVQLRSNRERSRKQ